MTVPGGPIHGPEDLELTPLEPPGLGVLEDIPGDLSPPLSLFPGLFPEGNHLTGGPRLFGLGGGFFPGLGCVLVLDGIGLLGCPGLYQLLEVGLALLELPLLSLLPPLLGCLIALRPIRGRGPSLGFGVLFEDPTPEDHQGILEVLPGNIRGEVFPSPGDDGGPDKFEDLLVGLSEGIVGGIVSGWVIGLVVLYHLNLLTQG